MDRKLPLDLDRTRIRRSLFGYNRRQVDEYLRHFRDQAVKTQARLRELEEELEQARAEAPAVWQDESQYVSEPEAGDLRQTIEPDPIQDKVEASLREVLQAAHRIAEEIKLKAELDAAQIIDDAKLRGEEQLRQARQELSELRWELERLRLDKHRSATAPNGLPYPLVSEEELAALHGPDPEPTAESDAS